MSGNPESRFDLTRIAQELDGEGYVVLEGLLDSDRLREWRSLIDRLAEQERRSPFLPGDGPVHPGDEEIESYLGESYAVSREELARMMQRVRHTRAENRDTPWPVGPREINKTFMHIPNTASRPMGFGGVDGLRRVSGPVPGSRRWWCRRGLSRPRRQREEPGPPAPFPAWPAC